MKEATFSVYITRGIVQYAAARYGVDSDRLCTAVGIEPALLTMPDRRISGTLHSAVWREAVKRTGDENLGLHLGEVFNLATFGIVGYVLVNCQTFEEVLEKLSRYTHLFSQGAYIHFSVSDGMVFCDCDIVDDLKNYLLEQPRYAVDSTFASLMKATQTLTGNVLYPHAVWFQYPRPADTAEHDRIFGTGLHFSMPTNRIIFDANCLKWQVLSANASLLSVFEQHAEAMLDAMNRQDDYTRQVVQAIAQNLKGELPSIEAIARSLAISVRQLQRELQAEGTSYQQLLDDTRKELALRHLKNPNTPIHDVAFLLGFSEPSAFHRAFKRWTGQTPRTYRV
ncbi:AraC family transcriptional regulator [Dendronalium sp. ChiSLP03b]|uniref:AraC family transcriptional regulator n=1 Tax=Dendronalium sp. ChiSLP03b TaxID=3075381 RepID=UPI002AD46CD1|nr:AraC family transcriptional regulator [Dendronalium sp. ChiSLP03b]MDZ8203060.1 AraC family transcriptional regulator [Dendronalium sp. ChiSLP03b]